MKIVSAVTRLEQNPALMILAKSDNQEYLDIAQNYGVELIMEAFADRMYSSSGHLVSRNEPDAVHQDREIIIRQVQELANGMCFYP